MKSYGQFCSFARALDLLGERWTLLVVRELLGGSTRFNDVRRGIPRISRTMLSARLRELTDAGVVTKRQEESGPIYELTKAGLELAGAVGEIRDVGTKVAAARAAPRGARRRRAPLGHAAPGTHERAAGRAHRRPGRAVGRAREGQRPLSLAPAERGVAMRGEPGLS